MSGDFLLCTQISGKAFCYQRESITHLQLMKTILNMQYVVQVSTQILAELYKIVAPIVLLNTPAFLPLPWNSLGQ